MNLPLEQMIEHLPELRNGHRLVVGIDGLSRSGKTTLTAALVNYFNDQHIPAIPFHLDDLIVERSRRYKTGEEPWCEYYQLQWDCSWLKQHFFQRLKNASELALPIYDGETDERTVRTMAIPPSCVVIVEGIFLQREEWLGCCDFVIYVNSPRDRRFQRESEAVQQNIEKFSERYWPAEEHYLTNRNPQKTADFIVQN